MGNCYIEYNDGRPPVCGQASSKQVCFNTTALKNVKSAAWYDNQPCPSYFYPQYYYSMPPAHYYYQPVPEVMMNPQDSNIMTIPVVTNPALAQGWQALCNGHFGGWYGQCRTNSADAKADADEHNRTSHGEERWATYVKRSC